MLDLSVFFAAFFIVFAPLGTYRILLLLRDAERRWLRNLIRAFLLVFWAAIFLLMTYYSEIDAFGPAWLFAFTLVSLMLCIFGVFQAFAFISPVGRTWLRVLLQLLMSLFTLVALILLFVYITWFNKPDYSHDTPVASSAECSGDYRRAAALLMDRHLAHYLQTSVGGQKYLIDYRITEIEAGYDGRTGEYRFTACYDVRLLIKNAWADGSGESGRFGWIAGKRFQGSFHKIKDQYILDPAAPGG